jgi:hypothetical protein
MAPIPFPRRVQAPIRANLSTCHPSRQHIEFTPNLSQNQSDTVPTLSTFVGNEPRNFAGFAAPGVTHFEALSPGSFGEGLPAPRCERPDNSLTRPPCLLMARPDRRLRPAIIRPRPLLGVPPLIRSLDGDRDFWPDICSGPYLALPAPSFPIARTRPFRLSADRTT